MDAAGWESWSEDVALREVTSFAERAQGLVGHSEAELKRQLGFPGQETPGTQKWSASHELTVADRDLRYFHLLPHVIVSFSIAADVVAFVGFMPKWRSCPPEFISKLGGAYAPE